MEGEELGHQYHYYCISIAHRFHFQQFDLDSSLAILGSLLEEERIGKNETLFFL